MVRNTSTRENSDCWPALTLRLAQEALGAGSSGGSDLIPDPIEQEEGELPAFTLADVVTRVWTLLDTTGSLKISSLQFAIAQNFMSELLERRYGAADLCKLYEAWMSGMGGLDGNTFEHGQAETLAVHVAGYLDAGAEDADVRAWVLVVGAALGGRRFAEAQTMQYLVDLVPNCEGASVCTTAGLERLAELAAACWETPFAPAQVLESITGAEAFSIFGRAKVTFDFSKDSRTSLKGKALHGVVRFGDLSVSCGGKDIWIMRGGQLEALAGCHSGKNWKQTSKCGGVQFKSILKDVLAEEDIQVDKKYKPPVSTSLREMVTHNTALAKRIVSAAPSELNSTDLDIGDLVALSKTDDKFCIAVVVDTDPDVVVREVDGIDKDLSDAGIVRWAPILEASRVIFESNKPARKILRGVRRFTNADPSEPSIPPIPDVSTDQEKTDRLYKVVLELKKGGWPADEITLEDVTAVLKSAKLRKTFPTTGGRVDWYFEAADGLEPKEILRSIKGVGRFVRDVYADKLQPDVLARLAEHLGPYVLYPHKQLKLETDGQQQLLDELLEDEMQDGGPEHMSQHATDELLATILDQAPQNDSAYDDTEDTTDDEDEEEAPYQYQDEEEEAPYQYQDEEEEAPDRVRKRSSDDTADTTAEDRPPAKRQCPNDDMRTLAVFVNGSSSAAVERLRQQMSQLRDAEADKYAEAARDAAEKLAGLDVQRHEMNAQREDIARTCSEAFAIKKLRADELRELKKKVEDAEKLDAEATEALSRATEDETRIGISYENVTSEIEKATRERDEALQCEQDVRSVF